MYIFYGVRNFTKEGGGAGSEFLECIKPVSQPLILYIYIGTYDDISPLWKSGAREIHSNETFT